MRPGSAEERERLSALFAELCGIHSPSEHEAAVSERVTAELREIGAEPEADEHGNLLARLPGGEGAERTILLCAHLDTVPHEGDIEPVLEEGVWRNAKPDAILGADNKAALAVQLLAARRAAAEPPSVHLELLFTVGEEQALRGAKLFDVARLRSDWGYVMDHATPIGEVIVASPTFHQIEAEFHGVPVHAGLHPEKGRSAIVAAAHALSRMELGRLDDETTANAGIIRGGTGVNIVPGRCRVVLEARSLTEQKVEDAVERMVDALQDGAHAADCDVDVDVSRLFGGYRLKAGDPAIRAAEAALRSRGVEPTPIKSGGGSDANALMAAGFPRCVNLANGTTGAHQPDEAVAQDDLDLMLDVTLALLEECAVVEA